MLKPMFKSVGLSVAIACAVGAVVWLMGWPNYGVLAGWLVLCWASTIAVVRTCTLYSRSLYTPFSAFLAPVMALCMPVAVAIAFVLHPNSMLMDTTTFAPALMVPVLSIFGTITVLLLAAMMFIDPLVEWRTTRQH